MEDCWFMSLALATGLTAAEAVLVSFANVYRETLRAWPAGAVGGGWKGG